MNCFGLSGVLLIPFLRGGLENTTDFTCGRWVILKVNFEKLIGACGSKLE